jgi:hypothetical protein
MVVADAAIEIAGVTGVVTVMVIVLLVAVGLLTHGILLVSTHDTLAPLLNEEVE